MTRAAARNLTKIHLALLALMLVGWAAGLAARHRPGATFPDNLRCVKCDALSFYSAARLLAHGEGRSIYDYTMTPRRLMIRPDARGDLPPGAPDILLRRDLAGGLRWLRTIDEIQYPYPDIPLFVYPPLNALLFLPMSLLPWRAATIAFDVLNLLALGAALLWIVLTLTAARWSAWPRLTACAALLVLLGVCFPLHFNLCLGQVTPLVAALAIAAAAGSRSRAGTALEGVAAAVAAGMKIFPGLLLVHFIAARQKRQAVAMALALAALALLSLLVFGFELQARALQVVRDMVVGAIPWFYNQSTDAFFQRFVLPASFKWEWRGIDPQPLKAVAALLKILLLGAWLIAHWSTRRRPATPERRIAAVALVLALFVLLPPIVWTHYYLFMLPGVLTLTLTDFGFSDWRRAAIRAWGVLLGAAIWINPFDFAGDGLYAELTTRLGLRVGGTLFRVVEGIPWLAALALFLTLLILFAAPVRAK